MERSSEISKTNKPKNYEFFRWIAIGFSIISFFTAIAVILYIVYVMR